MADNLLITNCRLFNSLECEPTQEILIENGIITEIGKVEKKTDHGCDILDAEERIVAPGLIDVHIQGAGGADVLEGTRESLQTIAKTCARFGTTSFLATTVFRQNGDNSHLEIAEENTGCDLGGANLLGIHLEGPFISLEKKGMILPEYICEPSLQVFNEIRDITKNSLRIMTIAPEFDNNIDIIHHLVDSGIIASFGHSNASFEETLEGIDAGISHVTHLFNAMPSIHHRDPGPLLAIFESKKISAQIISDGVHIHPAVLKFTFDLLGEDQCITITDGMKAIGLPDGKYIYGGLEYESKNGTARYYDGTLIGTALGLSQIVKKFREFTNCSLEAAIKTATENPARLLGIEDRKGFIGVGKDADLIIMDNDFSVWSTIVNGKIVYKKE